MRVHIATAIVLARYATAQIFDPLPSIISPSPGVTSSIITSASPLQTPASTAQQSGSGSPVQPTGSTTLGSTSTTQISSSPSTTISLRLSGTVILVTSSTDVSLSTVASSATSTAPPSASASGGINGERVAVIALATILGALVFGLAILACFLIRRRQRRQANPSSLRNRQNGLDQPTTSMRQRPTSWLGSIRRSRRTTEQYSNLPTQQYAIAATTQPLMSDGSPIYGFNSPRHAHLSPIFSGRSRGRQPPRNNRSSVDDSQRPANSPQDASPTLPIKGVPAMSGVRGNTYARNLSDHAIIDPPVHANTKSPELVRNSHGANRQEFTGSSDDVQHSQAPLGSHPVTDTSHLEGSRMLDVPVESDDGQTERSSSIPRAGFADAIAGLEIDPDESINATTPALSTIVEPSTSVKAVDDGNQISFVQGGKQPTISSPRKKTAERSGPRPIVPPLSIPKTLLARRQKSLKRTRFSIAGNEEVSPTAESLLDVTESERSDGRRPSTISPVSPIRNDRRVVSDSTAHLRYQNRVGSIDEAMNTVSIPTAISSRTVSNVSRKPSKPQRNVVDESIPLVQAKMSQPKAIQSAKPNRASVPAQIKRKPTPLDLAALIRKPLPPHPIPTSKYNQAARPVKKSETTVTSLDGMPPTIYENADDTSANLSSGQITAIRGSVGTTAYDKMVKGMSGISDQQTRSRVSSINPSQTRVEKPESEMVDNNAIISGYMLPASRAPSQYTINSQVAPSQNHPNTADNRNRNTGQFFQDPGNQEYAQVYGNYYAQPSPVQFSSPSSPKASNFPYPPTHSQQNYQPQSPQERARFLQPPFQQQQQQPQVQTRGPRKPEYLESSGYIKQTYQPAPITVANPIQPRDEVPATTTANSYLWRDSQQDAWRDSLSRSGSEPASSTGRSATGGIATTSNASSGGAGGPGLWGTPGFFGVE